MCVCVLLVTWRANGIVLYMYEGKVLMDIKIVPVVRNLGVYIDSGLTMKNQISNTVKVCNHHLRNITFIRKYLNEDTLKMPVHSLIM